MFSEIIMNQIDIVFASHSVIDSREDHHVESFLLLDKGIHKPVGTGRMHIIVHITGNEHQSALEIACLFYICRDLAFETTSLVIYSVECLRPLLTIDIVVMVAGSSHTHLVEVGTLQHSRHSHETAAGMSVDSDPRTVCKRISFCYLTHYRIIIIKRIIPEIAISVAMEGLASVRTAAPV